MAVMIDWFILLSNIIVIDLVAFFILSVNLLHLVSNVIVRFNVWSSDIRTSFVFTFHCCM
jgi:hypothetical protein